MRADITTQGILPITSEAFEELRRALMDAVEGKAGYPAQITITVSLRGCQIDRNATHFFSWTT